MTRPFERYGKTIRVEGGIKAQSTRGTIGESWWSQRFIDVLESFAVGTRLSRGRNYARQGQVLSLAVAPGMVSATVQGSRPEPYRVRIGLAAFSSATWKRVEKVLAEQAIFSARLLAGDMPAQIEEVFAKAGSPLFPTGWQDLALSCSCPDWQVPCKHLAATFYLLAEAFDADPFEILHWRGREKEELLSNLRKLRSGSSSRSRSTKTAPPTRPVIGAASALHDITSPALADTVDRFWVSPVPLPIRPPTLDTDVDLLLRQLPAPGPELGGTDLTAALRTAYQAFAAQRSP
jgi:uncharacterized Zn finger protein